MADILIADAVKGAGKFLAPFAGAIALIAAGVAAAEVWEHQANFKVLFVHVEGLGPQRDAQHQLAVTNATNWRAMKADRDAWSAAWKALQLARDTEAVKASQAVSAASAAKTEASSDAFDNGYAAGRAVGHNSCGATNAKATPGASGAASTSQSGGVWDAGTDFRAQWQHGAYVPAGGVLAKP